MDINYLDFGLYTINKDYVKYLYNLDSEVFYGGYDYSHKPYVGIIIGIDHYKYFIPLTSPKEKHAHWNDEDHENFLIYEPLETNQLKPNYVYKPMIDSDQYVKHILGVVALGKMIPVLDGLYTRINVNEIEDISYRNLLWKEILFCASISQKILSNLERLYTKQKETGRIPYKCVNFSLLEKASREYKKK